nr:MAG TPA_asm: hypothetical protein [Caudoviricetes sp.]
MPQRSKPPTEKVGGHLPYSCPVEEGRGTVS